MKCPSCNSQTSGDDKFCEDCGAPLSASSAEPSEPEAKKEQVLVQIPAETPPKPITPQLPVPAPAPELPVTRSGRAKISLDKETLNILLSEFASNDKAKLSYDQGRLVTDLGHSKISVNHLPLANTQLSVDGSFGKIFVAIAEMQMEDTELSLELDIGLQE